MNIQWIVFGCILIINAIIALLIAFYVSTKNETTGKPALILMMIALVIWSFSYAMVTFTRTLEVKLFWLKVENIGISLQPSFWFIYIFLYSFKGKTLSLWQIIPLFIIPVISLCFIFSNNWFYLYYSSVHPISQYGGPLAIERGTWYWVALMHSYALAIASIAILIWRFIKFGNVIRKQVYLLTAASLIPWGFNLTYQIISNLFPTVFLPVDFTPISFTISLGLIGTSVLRKPLMELVPIARDIVMDHIPEMVFVVDAHDRVLDANTVGTKWLGKSKDELIGRDPLEVFHEWPQVLNRLLYTEETCDRNINAYLK
ncbi:MAG: histidine kinase N-terminal 7TM domain-containing protein [Anaerolineales bacterium]